jgi:hypothetical protein
VQFDTKNIPTGIDDDTLRAFNVHSVGGPTIPRPQFAFQEPRTSQWNQEIVRLIVDAFLPGLAAAQAKHQELGETVYADRFMTRAFATRNLNGKLKHVFTGYRSKLPPHPLSGETAELKKERVEKEKELRKKLNRRSNRRRAVSNVQDIFHAQLKSAVSAPCPTHQDRKGESRPRFRDLGPGAEDSQGSWSGCHEL